MRKFLLSNRSVVPGRLVMVTASQPVATGHDFNSGIHARTALIIP